MVDDARPSSTTKALLDEAFPVNPVWFLIPATFDNIGCSLMYIALTEVAASIYQMMRGVLVVMTAAMAITILKRKLYLHHYTSLSVIVIAIVLVGWAGIRAGKGGDEEDTTSLFGVLVLLVS